MGALRPGLLRVQLPTPPGRIRVRRSRHQVRCDCRCRWRLAPRRGQCHEGPAGPPSEPRADQRRSPLPRDGAGAPPGCPCPAQPHAQELPRLARKRQSRRETIGMWPYGSCPNCTDFYTERNPLRCGLPRNRLLQPPKSAATWEHTQDGRPATGCSGGVEVFADAYPPCPPARTPGRACPRWHDAGHDVTGPGDLDLVGQWNFIHNEILGSILYYVMKVIFIHQL